MTNKIIKTTRKLYSKYFWLFWALVVIAIPLIYNYWDNLTSIFLPSAQSAWSIGGAGVTVGFIIMGISIAIGIALIASGIFIPGGIIILLMGVLWGAKVAGISILFGIVANFFRNYKFIFMIIGAILFFKWISRSRYTYRSPKFPSGDWFGRTKSGNWRKK